MAMIFFVVVTVAGSSLLSVSLIHRTTLIRSSADVRLMIAAEAGLESRRGMFALIAGVQETWTGLMPTSGWNVVGSDMSINGVTVRVEGRPIGTAETLQANLRATAFGSDRRRVVQYNIRAASFADYALYFGANNTVPVGQDFKMVGNYYSRGSLDLQNNSGVEFFGRVETVGAVLNAPNPVYNFKRGFDDYANAVTIPPSAYGLDPMRAAAAASGTLFYSNTISIQLSGQNFIRTYQRRNSGTGTTYTANQYSTLTQTLPIPDNGVIYVDSDRPPAGVDTYSTASNATNRYQVTQLNMWGVIDTRRVTLACENNIHVTNNVSYQTLLNNPNMRRFTEKQNQSSLNHREMLGVLSAGSIQLDSASWTALPSGSRVTDNAALNPPDTGHLTNQYSLDGCFMGVNSVDVGSGGTASGRELWVNGGLILGSSNNTELSGAFARRNYDTDYRLQATTPPYFLRAYGVTPLQVTGTWLSYEI